MDKNLLILGAGQYGQLAKETAESTGAFEKIDFLDDNSPLAVGKLADYESFIKAYSYAFVAIGNAEIRFSLIEKLKAAGYKLATLIHPRAYVSSSASVAEGCIVEPMAVVNTQAKLECGVFVCAGSVVNHGAKVGACCQIDCSAVVGANATVPQKCKVEYNQTYKK